MHRRCIASVAPMQSSRFLPGSVLVQAQPEARRGRGRSARHFVANEDQAGSNPVVRSTRPRSTKVVRRSRKPRASVRFRPRARSRVDHSGVAKRYCARPLTEEVLVRLQPLELRGRGRLARRQPCKQGTLMIGLFQASSILVARSMHTTPTPSSNGSGSETTNLRMAVRVRPESHIGRDLGSDWSPNPISGVRSLDGLQRGKQLTWW